MAQEYIVLKFSKNDDYCYRCSCKLVKNTEATNIRPAEEALRWEDVGGYFGNWDMYQQTIVLCDLCAHEVLGPWIKVKDVSHGPHAHRHWQRDDEAVLKRWFARKEKRRLQKTLATASDKVEKSRL